MIKLHHLNQSRSKRIIWLLEELGLAYEIVPYQRHPQTRFAPPELHAIHPLGKSPVIEDEGLVVAESGAIVEYLIGRYGADRLAPPADSPLYPRYLQWLHFAEGSAALPMLLDYFLTIDGTETRFLGRYAKRELAKILSYLNDEVSEKPYLVGEQFSGADIINSFVLETVHDAGGLANYSALQAYWDRITARPTWAKAAELEAQYDQS
ncbi:MAG: glutathione S-transferase [Anaerolineales bacterium]|nr:glutathione S-transferase [Anaerolineales bacterium]